MARFLPENVAVWFESPAAAINRATRFAGKTDEAAGHVYPDTPAPEGRRTHGVSRCTPTAWGCMKRVEDNGGKVVSSTIMISAGRFVYCLDPDGNSIGLFA